jgi:poly(3-hydroxybutyrate) depolymerase
LAGAQSGAFDTQLVSIIYGTQDFVVAQGYGQLNAEVFAELYGARTQSTLDVTQMPGFMPRGMAAAWADGEGERIQRIIVDGMGHAFPSGSGDSFEMSFVAARGVAWPAQMLAQFTLNSRRAQGAVSPMDAGVSPGVDAGTPPRDAGTPPGRDAGTPPRMDAATPRTDAGTVPGRDAASTSDDDAGSSSSSDDAGGTDAGGMTAGKVEGSGCSTHPVGLLDLAVALGLFAALGRRRSRRAAR